jgi:hypothetical protein
MSRCHFPLLPGFCGYKRNIEVISRMYWTLFSTPLFEDYARNTNIKKFTIATAIVSIATYAISFLLL